MKKQTKTKHAKRVIVEHVPLTSYTTEYTCPTCRVKYQGYVENTTVIEFRCSCGQKLKPRHVIQKPLASGSTCPAVSDEVIVRKEQYNDGRHWEARDEVE